jgi:hypothetical protein
MAFVGLQIKKQCMCADYHYTIINSFMVTRYFIDSSLRRVDSFSFDGATGDISNRKTITTLPEGITRFI